MPKLSVEMMAPMATDRAVFTPDVSSADVKQAMVSMIVSVIRTRPIRWLTVPPVFSTIFSMTRCNQFGVIKARVGIKATGGFAHMLF